MSRFLLYLHLDLWEILYVNYLSLGVTYVERLKFSYSFFLHSLGYLLFLTCGIYICGFEGNAILVWIMTIIASAVSGFCSSGLFIT